MPQDASPQPAPVGEHRQPVDAVHKTGPGFVNPQEIGHSQVPDRCISIRVMGLHLEHPRLGRRAVDPGADHEFVEQFSILIDPHALLADAQHDALVGDDRQGEHLVARRDIQLLTGRELVDVDAWIGLDELPDRHAYLPGDFQECIPFTDGVNAGVVADHHPGRGSLADSGEDLRRCLRGVQLAIGGKRIAGLCQVSGYQVLTQRKAGTVLARLDSQPARQHLRIDLPGDPFIRQSVVTPDG